MTLLFTLYYLLRHPYLFSPPKIFVTSTLDVGVPRDDTYKRDMTGEPVTVLFGRLETIVDTVITSRSLAVDV